MTPRCFLCVLYTERYGQAPDKCGHPEMSGELIEVVAGAEREE